MDTNQLPAELQELLGVFYLEKYNEAYSAVRKDILRKLSAIRSDFEESKDEPMDLELGEIYKNHLANVFKIIERECQEV